MQENRKRLLKSVYAVCFSALTVVVGLLFIVQVWSIFRSAEHGAFTVARISEHFKQIAVPVFFWGLALVVNIVLGYVYPDEKEKVKPYFESGQRIARLKKRLPKDATSVQSTTADTVGLVLGWATIGFACVAAIVSLVYLFDKSYSPVLSEAIFVGHNGAADRLLRVLVWCGGAMMLVVASVIFNDYLAKKKEERMKSEIAENAKQGKKVLAVKEEKATKTRLEKLVWYIRGAVAIVGIVFVITGICNGGMADVLKKAINICTQCIGLG